MFSIYPSLSSCNQLALEKTIKELGPWCEGFHLDLMDLHFVPNLALSPEIINTIGRVTKKQLWVHVMADWPERIIKLLQLRAGDIVSIHFESCPQEHLVKIVHKLKEQGYKASLALKPTTPVHVIVPFDKLIDHVLLMSVEPGLSGQAFLPNTSERLDELIALRKNHHRTFAIGVDGGINAQTLTNIKHFHLDTIAVGSAIFSAPDPVKALQNLQA